MKILQKRKKGLEIFTQGIFPPILKKMRKLVAELQVLTDGPTDRRRATAIGPVDLKMRNHLAEQVLDKDMLQLMLEFQKSEGANGCHLDGTIQLISATSEIISLFRDTRPLLSPDDVRMDKIQAALTWFLE